MKEEKRERMELMEKLVKGYVFIFQYTPRGVCYTYVPVCNGVMFPLGLKW